nr:MAG TPA: hypothetical protein [Bacteriophage sp.]
MQRISFNRSAGMGWGLDRTRKTPLLSTTNIFQNKKPYYITNMYTHYSHTHNIYKGFTDKGDINYERYTAF